MAKPGLIKPARRQATPGSAPVAPETRAVISLRDRPLVIVPTTPGHAKPPGTDLVPAPEKSTALTVVSEEQRFAAEEKRLHKNILKYLGLAAGSAAISLFGLSSVFAFCPPLGIAITVAGLAGEISAGGISLLNTLKWANSRIKLAEDEPKRIAYEPRTEKTPDVAQEAGLSALEALAKKPDLQVGDFIFFSSPADLAQKFALCVTEIKTCHEEADRLVPLQRIVARVHCPATENDEIAASPEAPGIGPISLLRPTPALYKLRLPKPALPRTPPAP